MLIYLTIAEQMPCCLPTQLGYDCSGFGLSIAARIGESDGYGLRSKKKRVGLDDTP